MYYQFNEIKRIVEDNPEYEDIAIQYMREVREKLLKAIEDAKRFKDK